MYKRERAGLEKNEIAFTLTNNSTLTSATINLFSLGTLTSGSNSGATTTAQQISVLNTSFSGTANWRFTYNTSLFEDVTDPTDIDDLITKLNVIFTENGQGIFWKEVHTAGSRWYLRVASSAYVFVNESHASSPTNTFTTAATGAKNKNIFIWPGDLIVLRKWLMVIFKKEFTLVSEMFVEDSQTDIDFL